MSRARHRTLDRKRLFLLALLTIVRTLLMLGIVTFVVLVLSKNDMTYLYVAAGLVVVLILFQLIHAMESGKVGCPHCRTPLFAASRCSKSKQAGKVLGSYRLAIAFQIVFTSHFICQFCGTRLRWRGEPKT